LTEDTPAEEARNRRGKSFITLVSKKAGTPEKKAEEFAETGSVIGSGLRVPSSREIREKYLRKRPETYGNEKVGEARNCKNTR